MCFQIRLSSYKFYVFGIIIVYSRPEEKEEEEEAVKTRGILNDFTLHHWQGFATSRSMNADTPSVLLRLYSIYNPGLFWLGGMYFE
jgi:hypothetical protein